MDLNALVSRIHEIAETAGAPRRPFPCNDTPPDTAIARIEWLANELRNTASERDAAKSVMRTGTPPSEEVVRLRTELAEMTRQRDEARDSEAKVREQLCPRPIGGGEQNTTEPAPSKHVEVNVHFMELSLAIAMLNTLPLEQTEAVLRFYRENREHLARVVKSFGQ